MQKKKSLGQHFLKSQAYVHAIADAADIKAGETVLEIGPGEGVLTRELLACGAVVTAVEKDHRLIPVLEETFAKEIAEKKLFVQEGDALEVEFVKKNYKLVANIPYYITGALLKKFLSGDNQPNTLVFLVQKEVAERVARSKKESILSLSIKVYGEVHYVKTVPRGAFAPAPDVDSAILAVKNISRNNFTSTAHEVKFFELVKTGFAQKRKLLRGNLERILGKEASEKMQSAGIPLNARAEDVPLEQWLELSQN